MNNADRNLVEIDPEKLGGTPVFRGTRVPIQNLFDSLESGESVGQFLDQYPTVSREQVLAVLEEFTGRAAEPPFDGSPACRMNEL